MTSLQLNLTGKKLVGALLLAVCIVAVFLPFTESFTESIVHRPLSILRIRPNPHQGGMFGGGFFYTYNALGNLPGLLSAGLSATVFLMLFQHPLRKPLLRTVFFIALFLHLLIFGNMAIAPFMLSVSDKPLVGYYVLVLAETGLFVLAFQHANLNPHISDPNLLDGDV